MPQQGVQEFQRDRGRLVSQWGFASHPLIDGQKLICLVGGSQGLVVAFDKDTGKELWHALSSKQTGYCPPMIYQVGARRELIIWDPEAVAGLDPETGQIYWTVPWRIHAYSSVSISTPLPGWQVPLPCPAKGLRPTVCLRARNRVEYNI